MITIHHRTASGSLDQLWEYDPVRRLVLATVRLGGSAPINIEIPAASSQRPRAGAYCLSRINDSVWRVAPGYYAREGAYWIVRRGSFDTRMPPWAVTLTHAPDHVSLELEQL